MEARVVRQGRVIALAAIAVACHAAPRPAPAPPAAFGFVGDIAISGPSSATADRIRAAYRTRLAHDAPAEERLLDAWGDHALVLIDGALVDRSASGSDRPIAFDPDLEIVGANITADGVVVVTASPGGTEADAFYVGDKRLAPRDVQGAVWSRDRATCLFATPGAIWLGDPRGTPAKIVERPGLWLPLDISRDGTRALIVHEVTPVVSAVFLVTIATGAIVPISPIDDHIAGSARFGHDDEVILQVDAAMEIGVPQLFLLRDRRRIPLVEDEVVDFAVSDDGDHIAYTTGRTQMRLVTIDQRSGDRKSRVVGGVIGELRFGGDDLWWSMSTPRTPRRVMRGLDGDDPPELPAALKVDLVNIEGLIPTFVFRRPDAKHPPVIVELHGGPEDRWRPSYDPRVLALVAQGYAVVRPNVRGSSGYGREFVEADDGDRRERAIDDVGSVLQWVTEQGGLDGRNIVLAGTSYGGFLALAAALRYQGFVRGVIDRFGIVDLVGFLAGTAENRRDQRRREYGDERVARARARLDALSPAKRIERLVVPLLVLHGRTDPRVPVRDVEAMLATVRRSNPSVWSAIATDEGHGFSRADHRAIADVLEDEFLAQLTR